MQGKTLLTSIYAVTRMILYPKTKIIVAAGQKSQARETVGKIKELAMDSPLLRNELFNGMKGISDSVNEPKVELSSGSWLRVVAAADSARGGRANLLIVDEFRLVPNQIVDTVLRKMQAAPRRPAFLDLPEYEDLEIQEKYEEINKQIFLSSAWFKAHESWEKVQSYNVAMANGRSYFGCAIPYQVSIKEGLKSRREVENEMSEGTFNEIMWAIEMDAIFWGENLTSFFKYEEIQKNRTLLKAYYPRDIRELLGENVLTLPKKVTGEVRVISGDIAVMGGAENDATILTVARCIPTSSGYERQIMYMESIEGGHTATQANRIRQLFEDFECDYLVLDGRNNGLGIYDSLNLPTVDPERGTEYEPWTCINNEGWASRCIYPNGKPVVYVILGTSELNSKIASGFKDTLRKGKMKFPIPENETKDTLEKYSGYKNLDSYSQKILQLPYYQTTLLVTEMLDLEDENAGKSPVIKLKESRSGRKDRYSSVSYLDYFVSEYLELELRGQSMKTPDPSSMFMIKQAKPRATRGGLYF